MNINERFPENKVTLSSASKLLDGMFSILTTARVEDLHATKMDGFDLINIVGLLRMLCEELLIIKDKMEEK